MSSAWPMACSWRSGDQASAGRQVSGAGQPVTARRAERADIRAALRCTLTSPRREILADRVLPPQIRLLPADWGGLTHRLPT